MTLTDAKINRSNTIYQSFKHDITRATLDVTLNDSTITVSAKDKLAYQDVWLSLLDEESGTIKTADGRYVTLTREQLYEVLRVMINKGKELWAKKETLLNEINNCETVEDVESTVW
jgi:hypothetical protein